MSDGYSVNELKVLEKIERGKLLEAELLLYKKLAAPFPEECIERTSGRETKKGYDTAGIGYQWVVNRFNEVLGLSNWGFSYKELWNKQGKWPGGGDNYTFCVEVSIWVLNRENIRTHVGGHTARTYEDALKGAITNAFKKCSALWGNGRQSYEGTLDDDNVPLLDNISPARPAATAKNEQPPLSDKITSEERKDLFNLMEEKKVPIEVFQSFVKESFGVSSTKELTMPQMEECVRWLIAWGQARKEKEEEATAPTQGNEEKDVEEI